MASVNVNVNVAVTAHLVLARPGYAELLQEELLTRFATPSTLLDRSTVSVPERFAVPNYKGTVFARQVLPTALSIREADLAKAALAVVRRLEILAKRPNRQKGAWSLHVFAVDDDAAVGRAIKLDKLLRAELKKRLPALANRLVESEDGGASPAFLAQVYLPSVEALWLSVATCDGGVSLNVAGDLRMRHRDGAPSRSARKLEEAFVEMGREPKSGETAVDLGAAPGGWTHALARHGASVTAVDNAELDLPDAKAFRERVVHLRENGLKYLPYAPVDWLCCDMVVPPRETLKLLASWLAERPPRHFVVNLKLPDAKPWPVIAEALALLASHSGDSTPWQVLTARHLYHDRREITLMGSRRDTSPPSHH